MPSSRQTWTSHTHSPKSYNAWQHCAAPCISVQMCMEWHPSILIWHELTWSSSWPAIWIPWRFSCPGPGRAGLVPPTRTQTAARSKTVQPSSPLPVCPKTWQQTPPVKLLTSVFLFSCCPGSQQINIPSSVAAEMFIDQNVQAVEARYMDALLFVLFLRFRTKTTGQNFVHPSLKTLKTE